jgi:membrane-associated phospholipid phosphatase
MLSALTINGLATMALKVMARTESPNGDEFGWPSGHTSSSFCFAAVMYEAYGPWVGVPLYAFAAFVGYERIDARNHDFADVISGALLGMAIGHAVAQNHKVKILGMDLVPYVDPRNNALGLALMKEW